MCIKSHMTSLSLFFLLWEEESCNHLIPKDDFPENMMSLSVHLRSSLVRVPNRVRVAGQI